jgi:acetyl-CoA carboxylase carboxyl transferase subunit beta
MCGFKKRQPARIQTTAKTNRKSVPAGIWIKCSGCHSGLYHIELKHHLFVCNKCQHHHRITARERLALCFDEQSYEDIASDVTARDPLNFQDSKKYQDRLAAAIKATKENEALLVGKGKLAGQTVVIAAFDFNFMGGSMGTAVGEKFVRGVNAAIDARCAYLCFAASGGARMQEGLLSLMQMAKTAAALNALSAAKLPFISILTDPTMGGVSASLAMLGDIIIAEPKALIGFAGPRVIEKTIRQQLPEGFQLSEFLLTHGAIDAIIDRREMKNYLATLIQKFQ